MKKSLLIALFLVSFLILASPVKAAFVTCGNAPDGSDACTICSFFQTLANIYNFLVTSIATPLAVLSITIGGIFIMISAGNPNLAGKGKQILYAGIIGLALVWCSWLIINVILTAMGYNLGTWWNPNLSC